MPYILSRMHVAIMLALKTHHSITETDEYELLKYRLGENGNN